MEDSKRRASIFFSRNNDYTGHRHYNNNKSHHKYNHNNHRRNYLWAIALILCPTKVLANTTVASPSSETVTRQNIYDEDTGAIKYVQETPRFEKENFNFNYGISAQISIPLGKAPALCHKATEVNIKNQKILYEKTKLEVALFRLRVCGEQAKLGVTFTGKYASICEGIAVTVPPGQVIPHTHKIDVKAQK